MRFKLWNINRVLYSTILAPILLSAYPILALWAYNFDRMESVEVVLPLVLAISGSLTTFFVLYLILKNRSQASLITSLLTLLFFTYGHVLDQLENIPGIGLMLAHHRILGMLWLFILIGVGYLILRYGKKANDLTRYLSFMSLVLMAIVFVQLIYATAIRKIEQVNHDITGLQNKAEFDPGRVIDRNNLPDIYLIVLDNYARDDVLRRELNYDNQPFLKQLSDLGFVIPKCSMSNYAWTVLSMSSELNMNYLDTFYSEMDPKAKTINYDLFTDYIRRSLVRENLTSLGYKTISFESEFLWVEIPDADIYYTSQTNGQVFQRILNPTEFGQRLSETTLLSMLPDAEAILPNLKKKISDLEDFFTNLITSLKSLGQDPYRAKYNLIMRNLNYMESIATVPGPKFVYLHLPAPHTPQVLGPNGEFMPALRDPGFQHSITYLNKRFIEIVGKIIKQSKVPPIIIMQGDHGFSNEDDNRMNIFNAYYLPGEGKKQVYSSITPVNSFRIIFNTYFGGKYPILKDTSNWGKEGYFFDFIITPPNCSK